MYFQLPDIPDWAPGEEWYNMITHFLGVSATFGSIFFIVPYSKQSRDRYKLIGNCIFIASLLNTYAISTIYHGLDYCFAKRIFRLLDHISIFFLIAGGYTPFAMTTLRHSNGKKLCIFEWLVAFIGILCKIVCFDAFEQISVYFYFSMGLIIFFNFNEFVKGVQRTGLICLFLEFLSFLIGVYFYLSYEPYYHAIWHMFVLLASFLHFVCVCFYI